MRYALITILAALVSLGSYLLAVQPANAGPPAVSLPKIDNCPTGYAAKGKFCEPAERARYALLKEGTCPSDYLAEGAYCVANSADTLHAVPKPKNNLPCTAGYSMAGAYCVAERELERPEGPLPPVPVPKFRKQDCPTGYVKSGGFCNPSQDARFAIPKSGDCPRGYKADGAYCLAAADDAQHAVDKPKLGPCPPGYHTEGNYCLID